MGKIIKKVIKRFDAGMTNKIRSESFDFSKSIKHFDSTTDPNRLNPRPEFTTSSITGTGITLANAKLTQVIAAQDSSADGTVQYALGVDKDANKIRLFSKTVAASGSWSAVANGVASSTLVAAENVMVEYQGKIYGWADTDEDGVFEQVWSYTIASGSEAFDNNDDGALAGGLNGEAINNVAQGLVHSKDDILYMPYDNKIAKNNAGTWTDVAITMPTDSIISSICEYGNYLVIATRPKFVQGRNSQVYLWDRDASLTTLSDKINWGPEQLLQIEEIDGTLVGVSIYGNTSTETLTSEPSVVFKRYDGGTGRAKKFLEFTNLTATPKPSDFSGKQKVNNKMYFQASLNVDNSQTDAIWSLAKQPDGKISLLAEYLYNNGDSITTPKPKGFLKFGDYLTANYTDSGTYKSNVTINGAATYDNATSRYETLIIGDGVNTFKLNTVGVITEPIIPGGSTTIGYRINDETSYTDIFSFSSKTATITIASPAVVTSSSHGLVAGNTVTFSTTLGDLPTGITAGTKYYVISTGLTTDAFQFSATEGGSAVNTSGSQSGVHAITAPVYHEANIIESTGESLPDFRELKLEVQSTGGAVVTGLYYELEQITNNPSG